MIIPIFVALPLPEFADLRSSEDRSERAFELIESDGAVSTDIDKDWEVLREVFDKNDGPVLSIDGSERWEDDPLTAVLTPNEVSTLASALTDFDDELAEDAEVGDALDELVAFYTAAAARGDAVIIVYN